MRVPLTKELRTKIFERDDFTCQYCGRSAPDVALEIDHVIPVSKGGNNDESNLVTSCRACNVRKSDDDYTDELRLKLKESAENPDIQFRHSKTKETVPADETGGEKDIYIFPAILDYADDGITIDFPDLPGCMPCAFSSAEALHNAREALALHLYNMEDDGDVIPEPSDILKVPHGANQAVILVEAFMPPIREKHGGKAVNKMVTLPQWVISAGKRAGLNFSLTLKEAVIEKLNLTR